jgi:hypothetical protein
VSLYTSHSVSFSDRRSAMYDLTSVLKTYSNKKNPRLSIVRKPNNEKKISYSLDNGIVSPSENSKNRYFNVSLCNCVIDISISGKCVNPWKTYEEKCLHLVLERHRHVIDVDDRRISATRDPTMRLDCLEYCPAVIAVALISRQPKRDKQRFDGLRPF